MVMHMSVHEILKKVGFVIVRKKQWTDSPFFCKLQRMIKTFVAGWQL